MQVAEFKLNKYEFVSVTVPAGDTTNEYYFPDLPNLRNAKVSTLSAYYSSLLAKTPDNIDLISLTDLESAYLVLNISDKEDIKIPMFNLLSIVRFAADFANQDGYPALKGKVIRWPQSYIKFPDGHGVMTKFNIAIGVFYQ